MIPTAVKTVSFGSTPMKKFPSTSTMAEKEWHNYLDSQLKEGWVLTNTFEYNLGVEKRQMLVFYQYSETPKTVKSAKV